jgi:hypothetical protein
MSTTIRDSSLTTARRRQLALFGFRQDGSTAPEQAPSNGNKGTGPSADVGVAVLLGKLLVSQSMPPSGELSNGVCSCAPSITLAGYSKVGGITNGRNNE